MNKVEQCKVLHSPVLFTLITMQTILGLIKQTFWLLKTELPEVSHAGLKSHCVQKITERLSLCINAKLWNADWLAFEFVGYAFKPEGHSHKKTCLSSQCSHKPSDTVIRSLAVFWIQAQQYTKLLLCPGLTDAVHSGNLPSAEQAPQWSAAQGPIVFACAVIYLQAAAPNTGSPGPNFSLASTFSPTSSWELLTRQSKINELRGKNLMDVKCAKDLSRLPEIL